MTEHTAQSSLIRLQMSHMLRAVANVLRQISKTDRSRNYISPETQIAARVEETADEIASLGRR